MKTSMASMGLIALGFVVSTGAAAQGAGGASPDPACVSRPDCRFIGSVTIRTDQGVKTPALNRNMPFLRTKDGRSRLWLVLGERVDFRLGGPGEPPITILAHGPVTDPEKSKEDLKDKVEIEFAQMANSTGTNLTVRNGYGRQLQYKAFLLAQNGEEKPTSTCPVRPGIFSFENWQGPLLEIELADFQLVDAESNSVVCK